MLVRHVQQYDQVRFHIHMGGMHYYWREFNLVIFFTIHQTAKLMSSPYFLGIYLFIFYREKNFTLVSVLILRHVLEIHCTLW